MKSLFVFIRIAIAALLLLPVGGALALNANHQCTFCHNLHGGAVITPPAQQQTMCLTCHGPAGISIKKAAEHRNARGSNYPVFNFSCRNCHDPHSSRQNWQGKTNIKMVGVKVDATRRAKIATPKSGNLEVVFESRGSSVGQPTLHSFADSDQDRLSTTPGPVNGTQPLDGICEVCHTVAGNHTNTNVNDTHNTGETCSASCHLHSNGFMRRALP